MNVLSLVLNGFENDSRVLKENLTLARAGFSIQIAAIHKEGLNEKETIDIIQVHRIKINKILPKTSYIQILFKVFLLYRKGVSIVHCNDLMTLPIGLMIKLFSKNSVKIIYDAHEYETETKYLNPMKKRFLKVLERVFIKHVDKVITVSNSISEAYVSDYCIEKPSLVLNCPNYVSIEKKNLFREKFKISDNQLIYLYQGGLEKGRNVELILEAFSNYKDAQKTVVFMGYGSLEKLVKEYSSKYSNIFYHESVNQDVLLNYTASADFGLLFYENNCLNHYYCLPNKLFEYFMAGLPVIVSDLYELRKIVTENEVGIVAKENSVRGILDAIKESEFLNRSNIKARLELLNQKYCWEEQEKELLSVYNNCLRGRYEKSSVNCSK